MGGNLKARGAGGSSSCGGPKGKKKNGRNRGGKANNPPYLPPEVSTWKIGGAQGTIFPVPETPGRRDRDN